MSAKVIKQPLKVINVPLAKFTDEMIPHHQRIFEQYKCRIQKLIGENNFKEVGREINDKKRIIKQLKDLMYELDTLRAQVEDCNLDEFDDKTLSLRKTILTLLKGYADLSRQSEGLLHSAELENITEDPFVDAAQIQITEDLEDIKLREYNEKYEKYQALHDDVKDLHIVFGQLNEIVLDQKQSVSKIHDTIEETNENVHSGFKDILVAHKLKAAVYPVTGAVLGGMVGGPIGLLAGAKIGGLAAVCCAIAGYTGGRIYKRAKQKITNDDSTSNQVEDVSDVKDKKDI